MIVIGLDVHKQSVTAVAVDEAGRPLAEKVIPVGSGDLLDWAGALDAERLWAVEDCRQLTRWLERQLLSVGEDLVRVPPKLTVPERRAGRTRGKSDPIDALAIARAALREPDLSRPQPGEQASREIKLLVDHRDDLSISAGERSSGCAGTCSNSTRPTSCRYGCSAAPHTWSASAAGSPAKSRSCRCDSHASSSPAAERSTARSLSSTNNSSNGQGNRAWAARVPRLRGHHRRQAARRDRPDRSLQDRRTTRPTRRRRAIGSELRTHSAPPVGPRRQPPTQRRALSDRDHPIRYHPPPATTSNANAPKAKPSEAIRCLKRLLVRAIFHTLKAAPALT